jgi:CspA family cold shock protein
VISEVQLKKGIVKFYNEDKGFGFIQDLEKQEHFIHYNIAEDMNLRSDDEVLFCSEEREHKGIKRMQVIYIVKIPK